jgi:hypothetical protein
MPTTITNGNFDGILANVKAPYGPITRSEAVPAHAPNSDMQVAVASALSVAFTISFDQLNDVQTANEIAKRVHSVRGINHPGFELEIVTRLMAEYMESYAGPPFTDVEWQTMIDGLRIMKPMVANVPNRDYPPDEQVHAGFTVVDDDAGAAGLDATATDTSTGNISMYLWDWGDGEYSVGAANNTHTYVLAGTYTVTLYVIGPGGVDWAVASLTMTGSSAPVVSFTVVDDDAGGAGLDATITDANTGTITKTYWLWGDGTITEDAVVTHTYAGAGTYQVGGVAIGPGGSDSDNVAVIMA